MKNVALALMAAGLLSAASAFAQGITVRAGEGGITVRSQGDDGSRMRERGERRVIIRGEGDNSRLRDRRSYPRRDRDVDITGSTGCYNTVVRTERPNGDVMVRRVRRCD